MKNNMWLCIMICLVVFSSSISFGCVRCAKQNESDEVVVVAKVDRNKQVNSRGYGFQKTNRSSKATKNSTRKNNSYGTKRRTYNSDTYVDPDDYDVEGFYYDNRSDFANEDDAWDYLEDEPDDWD